MNTVPLQPWEIKERNERAAKIVAEHKSKPVEKTKAK